MQRRNWADTQVGPYLARKGRSKQRPYLQRVEAFMFEHVWAEETCSWIVAPPDRVPGAGDLETAELYFVWGFLMDPRFIGELVGRPVPFAPAAIRGYRREAFVEGGQRGFRLIPDDHGIVMGVVLVGPTGQEVAALDRFEQVPTVMIKRRIDVLIGDLVREANIYIHES